MTHEQNKMLIEEIKPLKKPEPNTSSEDEQCNDKTKKFNQKHQ